MGKHRYQSRNAKRLPQWAMVIERYHGEATMQWGETFQWMRTWIWRVSCLKLMERVFELLVNIVSGKFAVMACWQYWWNYSSCATTMRFFCSGSLIDICSSSSSPSSALSPFLLIFLNSGYCFMKFFGSKKTLVLQRHDGELLRDWMEINQLLSNILHYVITLLRHHSSSHLIKSGSSSSSSSLLLEGSRNVTQKIDL